MRTIWTKNCVSRSKQDVTDIIRCVVQHQVGDCDNDNDLDDELQIPQHGFDNEDAVSHAKNLKDPSKYILQSCHDNDNYTNEVLKLLHEESNQTKFSKTSAMDLSSNYVIFQDETQAMMNGKCMRSEAMSSCRDLTLKSVWTSIFKILKRVMNSVALKYISSQVIDKLVLMEKETRWLNFIAKDSFSQAFS